MSTTRNIRWIVLFVWVLAACGGRPVVEKKAAVITAEPPLAASAVPTSLPTRPAAGVETEAPASSAVSSYQIVPGESKVEYQVGETFFNQSNRFNLAVGVTTQITGSIQVDAAAPQNSIIGRIGVNISQFKSDSARRDGVIRDRFLESGKFPLAIFMPTRIENLPTHYGAGEEITFRVTGDLTVRQVTRPATFDVRAKLANESLTGSATTTILMSDYGVGPIQLAGILGTEDQVKLIFTFVARP